MNKGCLPLCECIPSPRYDGAPLPTYFNLLTSQEHESVHGLKLMVERDDSFEFLTASDKCSPCALHELLAVIFCTYRSLGSLFNPGFLALILFQFGLLNGSVCFRFKLK